MEPGSASSGARERPIAPLIRAAARGDSIALASLYDETAPRVYGLLVAVLRDPRAAEDALVEVYGSLRREKRECPDGVDPLGWLLLRARERALALRKDGARADAARAFPDTTADALDDDERRVVEWAFLGGLGDRDIAARLEVSRERVRALLRAGIRKLQNSVAWRERLASSLPGRTSA
ncbi:MAG TPA: sigma factor-like helix-turn-helix DNA-binding protein [Planctomycetota bacterium]|nr:sigma factor-like helix-turn-helix DNA-binding protein [Planctomycetota bacterium]